MMESQNSSVCLVDSTLKAFYTALHKLKSTYLVTITWSTEPDPTSLQQLQR